VAERSNSYNSYIDWTVHDFSIVGSSPHGGDSFSIVLFVSSYVNSVDLEASFVERLRLHAPFNSRSINPRINRRFSSAINIHTYRHTYKTHTHTDGLDLQQSTLQRSAASLSGHQNRTIIYHCSSLDLSLIRINRSYIDITVICVICSVCKSDKLYICPDNKVLE
jgi:hypothetical protein